MQKVTGEAVYSRPEKEVDPYEPYSNISDAFLDLLEVFPEGWGDLDILAVNVDGRILTLRELLDEFENDENILPGSWCGCVGLPSGATYSEAVVAIREQLGLG